MLPASREERASKGKFLSSLQEGSCNRTTLHGGAEGPGSRYSSQTEEGARTLPHPSEQGTAAAATECIENCCHRTWDGRKSQRQPKPQLLPPELTLDVTCCSADTQQRSGRSHKRRASPRLDTRQEATPKCRQSMSTAWVAQRLCGALSPCLSPSLSCSPLHMPVTTQATQMVRRASPPCQLYDTYIALPPLLQEFSRLVHSPHPMIQLHQCNSLQHLFLPPTGSVSPS